MNKTKEVSVGLFDAIVHHDKPPLNWLGGGYYFTMTMVLMQFGHFVLLNHYGVVGYFIYMLLVAIFITLDGFVSTSMGKNIVNLRLNGYSDKFILFTMVFNCLGSQALTLLIIHFIGNPQAMHDLLLLSTYSTPMIMAVAANLIATEVLFFAAHKFLHEHWPSIHIMHHCCMNPSHSTNLIFHPIDLAIEFAGPGSIILLNHYTIWQQNLHVLLLSYMIMQIYYAIDHSEWLRTYHFKHHSQLNAVYTIYANYRSTPQLDKLRSLVIKPSKNT
ncbi:hypothetical protein THRCLA_02822 [Thraustotheca clavata]|uniref:Fatty acid hydroxylase domain-containing protein n=1 Tax=Thraustotheca clavata TaxID=74557 RepID=A0A1W0A461_9STRA|nr:hypothetical protein THRCLA_02822 [Thraustotheca clavata]